MTDLVDRLKEVSIQKNQFEITGLLHNAATEIASLRRELEDETAHRKRLQKALFFWMPSVWIDLDIELQGRVGADSYLLAGYDGDFEDTCWGDEMFERAKALKAQLEEARTALQWIIDNPGAHPMNMWRVAQDGLRNLAGEKAQ